MGFNLHVCIQRSRNTNTMYVYPADIYDNSLNAGTKGSSVALMEMSGVLMAETLFLFTQSL